MVGFIPLVIVSPWFNCANKAERDAVASSFAFSVSMAGGGPGGGGGGGGGDGGRPCLFPRAGQLDVVEATGP